MENIDHLKDLLAGTRGEAQKLTNSYTELDGYIEKEAEHVARLDKVVKIDIFKAWLVNEVNRIHMEEEGAESIFDTGKLYSGILGFTVGSIAGALSKQGRPLASGGRLLIDELGKKASFGNVMIVLKKDCDIKEAEVVSISHLAREAKTSEAEIISSMKQQGYSLITPEECWPNWMCRAEWMSARKYR